jgi:hypothetical protein
MSFTTTTDPKPVPKPNRKAIQAARKTREAQLTGDDPKATPAAKLKRSFATEADAQARHEQRLAWFVYEASRQSLNRQRMALCEQFYDNEQYDAEGIAELEERGQRPVVYNEVKPTIDWLIGTERRARVDFFVTAEEDDPEADDDARVKTKLMKFHDSVNRAAFERSEAAEDAFKAGIGWMEVGLRGDGEDSPVYIGSESWRNILWDSVRTKKDLSNARYMFRIVILDLDVAIAAMPEHEEDLKHEAIDGDPLSTFGAFLSTRGAAAFSGLDAFMVMDQDVKKDGYTAVPLDIFNTRRRVLLLECWSREPKRMKREKGLGYGDPVTFEMRVSIMLQSKTLIEEWSPYKHKNFPWIPVWGYRNRRTGLPYSPIWPLIGPQEALNARMSRSIFEAASNRMEIEAGAIDQKLMPVEKLRLEWNKPDGVAVYKDGTISGGKVREMNKGGVVEHMLQLADQDRNTIRMMAGVTGENRGLDSNANSGKAIIAKQEQGGLVTAELFDHLWLARQLEGERVLSLTEQYCVHPMTVRTPGRTMANVERTKINQLSPDGSKVINDITARKARFTVGEQAWKQSYAEAAFDSIMQVLSQLAPAAPQIVINLLDVVFEMHPNLPMKQVVLDRIRAVNGQADPDGNMTPEQQAQRAQQRQVAKAQFDAQMAKLRADVAQAEAAGQKLNAEAVKTRLTALYEAAQAAQVIAMTPAITPIADTLLESAGFQPQGGAANVIPADQMPPPGTLSRAPGLPVQAGGGAPDASAPGAPGGTDNPPQPAQAAGVTQGIQTARPDGAVPQPAA